MFFLTISRLPSSVSFRSSALCHAHFPCRLPSSTRVWVSLRWMVFSVPVLFTSSFLVQLAYELSTCRVGEVMGKALDWCLEEDSETDENRH